MLTDILGTVKTDNQISFDSGTIVRVIVGGFIAAVLSGLTIKALAKVLNI